MRTYVTSTVIVLLVARISFADIKRFTGTTSNDWHTDGNWDSFGVPGSDDDVIIPPTLTCEISSGLAEARTVDVAPEAKLQIDSQDLKVHAPAPGVFDLRVLGRLEFKKSGTATPRLLYPFPGIRIVGTGLIDASVANGLGPGIITNFSGQTGHVVFDSQHSGADLFMRVKGSLTFDIKGDLYISNAGGDYGAVLIVDHVDDVMDIGKVDTASPTVNGKVVGVKGASGRLGEMRVEAGVMRLGQMQAGPESVITIRVNGGKFHVTASVPDNTHTPAILLIVDSGEAIFDTHWISVTGPPPGGLRLNGGQISTKSGKRALFP